VYSKAKTKFIVIIGTIFYVIVVLHCLLTLGTQSLPTIVSENTTNEVNETSTMTKTNGNINDFQDGYEYVEDENEIDHEEIPLSDDVKKEEIQKIETDENSTLEMNQQNTEEKEEFKTAEDIKEEITKGTEEQKNVNKVYLKEVLKSSDAEPTTNNSSSQIIS
jgi:hypothetical protein